MGVRAWPGEPTIAAGPVVGPSRWAASASRARSTAIAVKPRTTGSTRLSRSCSSGRGESTRIIDPKTRLTIPPAVSSPKLVTLSSSTRSRSPKNNSSTPTMFTGSTENAKNASSRHKPPTMPGTIAPGFHNSIVSASVPRLMRRYATVGFATALSTR